MPFGTRTGFLDHAEEDVTKRVTIKFDSVWKSIIKRAIPAGFNAIRADELREPGIIDRKYMRCILDAELLIADLTFSNPNVYYEVGIRQALITAGTVLVACRGTKLPFDLRNQTVHYYPYFESPEIDGYRKELRSAIKASVDTDAVQSPVYVFLPELRSWGSSGREKENTNAAKVERIGTKLDREKSRRGLLRLFPQVMSLERPPVSLLEDIGIKLRKFGEFDLALQSFEKALSNAPDDPEILREIGFCYRKKGPEHYVHAESFLRNALTLNPNDFDALGMLGGLCKRDGDFKKALEHYEAAFAIEPFHSYPLVTLGAIHAAMGNFKESERFYKKLTVLCEKQITNQEQDYWTYLCLGEVAAVQRNIDNAKQHYETALAQGAPPEDLMSAMEQLKFLTDNNVAVAVCNKIIDEFRSKIECL